MTTKHPPIRLALAAIRTDGGTQARAAMNPAAIHTYAREMRDGVAFDPIVVFYDGDDYWLADGFHRVAAARDIGADAIDARVLWGTKRDALLYAVGANARHGVQRTNADKRKAVTLVLADPEASTWSNERIAAATHTSETFVRQMRDRRATDARTDHDPTPLAEDVLRGTWARRLDHLNAALRGAPDDVQRVVEAYGVDEPDTVRILTRLHRSAQRPDSFGTFDDIARTGFVQITNEYDAVPITASPDDIRTALRTLAHMHAQQASEDKTPTEVFDLVYIDVPLHPLNRAVLPLVASDGIVIVRTNNVPRVVERFHDWRLDYATTWIRMRDGSRPFDLLHVGTRPDAPVSIRQPRVFHDSATGDLRETLRDLFPQARRASYAAGRADGWYDLTEVAHAR